MSVPKSKFVKNSDVKPSTSTANSTEKIYEKQILGVFVQLPENPYDCQVAIMQKVIGALQKESNCILESPTGTGKTLAVLCSTLAWQQKVEKEAAKMETENQSTTPVKKFRKLSTATTPDKTPRKLLAERSIYDAEQRSNDSREFGLKRKLDEMQGPTGNGLPTSSARLHQLDTKPSTSSCWTPGINLCKKEQFSEAGLVTIHEKPTGLSPPKIEATIDLTGDDDVTAPNPNAVKKRVPMIYYGSRTHKQLEQVIKEFERTPYCGAVRMTVLSSREHSCIRHFDRHAWPTKRDMCNGCTKKIENIEDPMAPAKTKCVFYDNRKLLTHRTLPKAFNLDLLLEKGRQYNACPYYAAKYMAASSEIVFCPYNYLIDPAIRSNMNINLKDNVVIIDEAHNIEATCRDAATFTVERAQIVTALNELEKTTHRLDPVTLALHQSLNDWDYWFQNHRPYLKIKTEQKKDRSGREKQEEKEFEWKKTEDFVLTLNNHNIGQAEFPKFSASVQQLSKRMNEDPRAYPGVTAATLALLETLHAVLDYLFGDNKADMNDFVMVLSENAKQEDKWGRQGLCLRVLCMNPGVVFAGLRAARSVLLASATLAPLGALAAELGAAFPLSATPVRHVLPADRVWVGVATTGPGGPSLELTYKKLLKDHQLADALGKTLLRACACTPHGVLCFLPSYSVRDRLEARWRKEKLWDELEQLKHVFRESKNVSEHSHMIKEYNEKVMSEKGALILAVYRGKVAEGMDFRDEQARLVIAMGIPYPNLMELAVERKRQYNDSRHHGDCGGLLDGQAWYKAQAFRALNQAIGRCIRHSNDWGAVLLVDERWMSRRFEFSKQLPMWLREVYLNKNTEKDIDGLRSFMEKMRLQKQ